MLTRLRRGTNGSPRTEPSLWPERRDQRRKDVTWTGRLLRGSDAVPCIVRDVSAGGCRVDCDEPLLPNTTAVLDIDEIGQVMVRVRWGNGGRHGVRFLERRSRVLALFAAG